MDPEKKVMYHRRSGPQPVGHLSPDLNNNTVRYIKYGHTLPCCQAEYRVHSAKYKKIAVIIF